MSRAAFLLFAVAVLSAGCAARRAHFRTSRHLTAPTAIDYAKLAMLRNKPVALLPFDNQSLDLLGPDMLRKLVADDLRSRGYVLQSLNDTDEKLKAVGITDGGQLASQTSAAVGAALGVEGMFYGTVEDFNFTNIGFFIQRVVRIRLRLLSLDGSVIWESGGEGVTRLLATDKRDAGRQFVRGIAEKAAENMLRSPLAPESHRAVRQLMATLPAR